MPAHKRELPPPLGMAAARSRRACVRQWRRSVDALLLLLRLLLLLMMFLQLAGGGLVLCPAFTTGVRRQGDVRATLAVPAAAGAPPPSPLFALAHAYFAGCARFISVVQPASRCLTHGPAAAARTRPSLIALLHRCQESRPASASEAYPACVGGGAAAAAAARHAAG